MSGQWIEVVPLLAVQHLAQGAVLALLALLLPALRRWIGADARSWLLACAFALAAVSPLAVFLPGESIVAHVATQETPSMRPAAGAPLDEAVVSVVAGSTAIPPPPASSWRRIAPAIAICVWLSGVLWHLRRLAVAWREAARLRRAAVGMSEAGRRFAGVVPGDVEIRVSDTGCGPMVVGFARPCILLPRRFVEGLPEATLASILRHEVAHVHRRDTWAMLVQAVCLAVYWWSPVLRFLGARLDATREMACDERAALQSDDAASYAGALLDGAAMMRPPGDARLVLAAGIFDTHHALTHRIEGLLSMNPAKRVSGNRAIVASCGLVVLASASLSLLASPRLDRAPLQAEASSRTSGERGGALLIDAVNARRFDALRTLVRNGMDVDAGVGGDGTPLIVAAKNGDLEAVDVLLGLGASVDRPMRGDGNPLIAAAARGHLDVVERLVAAGADVNAIVVDDETPLINAARSGGLPVSAYLVEHGADVNLGVTADFGRWRSPLNQAGDARTRAYLAGKGAVLRK